MTVGQRIRALREERGLSQMELAEGLLTGSYLSLIEAGKRNPRPAALDAIAERLGCSVDYLRTGRGGPAAADLELELRFAELARRSGDQAAARERYDDVLQRARALGAGYEDHATHALWGRSRAAATMGDAEAAIEGFLEVAAMPDLPAAVSRVSVLTSLAYNYATLGMLDRAIEVGEQGLAAHAARETAALDTEELIRLAATLADCYRQRGDLVQAAVLIRRVIAEAERSGSPSARAAGYWNAAWIAKARGDMRAARDCVERAIALFGEGDGSHDNTRDPERALARLRLVKGVVIAESGPDGYLEAIPVISAAIEELREVGQAFIVACGQFHLARCKLLAGDTEDAAATASAAVEGFSGVSQVDAARARVLLARASHAMGDGDSARRHLRDAISDLLPKAGVAHATAEAWRDVADALLAIGDVDQAVLAYQKAADSAGLRGLPVAYSRSPAVSAVRD